MDKAKIVANVVGFAVILLFTLFAIAYVAYKKDNRQIPGSHIVILEHICKKNEGIDYFKMFNDKYDVRCRDGAQFLDIKINIKQEVKA